MWPALPASTTVVTPEPTPKISGIDAEGAEPFHQMQMNVDQSRRDDVIFDIDHGRAVRFEIRSDGVDPAVADANVEHAILACRQDRSDDRL